MQGSGFHQLSCVEELLGTDLVTSLAVLSGSSSDPSLPLGRSLEGILVYLGCGHRAEGSLTFCPFLCYPCPSASNSCLSLSPFPSVCVRLLTGRIQVSSGNAFSLPRGCVRGPFPAHSFLGWSCCSRGCSCPTEKLGRDERHWPGWEYGAPHVVRLRHGGTTGPSIHREPVQSTPGPAAGELRAAVAGPGRWSCRPREGWAGAAPGMSWVGWTQAAPQVCGDRMGRGVALRAADAGSMGGLVSLSECGGGR